MWLQPNMMDCKTEVHPKKKPDTPEMYEKISHTV